MKHRDVERRLNEYVDGVLSASAAADVETHLTACESCGRAVDRMRMLRNHVQAAPRTIQPSRDLWPEIAQRLDGPRLGRRAPARPSWHLLAAAALLLVAVTAAITVALVRDGAGRGQGEVLTESPRVARALDGIEAEYGRAITELEEALQVARERLTPETVELIERNLGIIDEAIAEARAALIADPNSEDVWKALSRRYEDRLDLLRQTSRLATRS